MAATAAAVISIAKAEVGYHEGYSNGHWNNNEKYADQVPGLAWANWQAWCATFVSYCAYKAGAGALYPCTASCATGVEWFKKDGRWSEYPAVGAQVFYGSGGGDHTGLVVSYTADTITTVEGNTNTNGSAEGDGVYLKTRQRRDSYVYGYGYPRFVDGIQSADPAYAGQGPKTPPPADKPSVSLAHIVAAAKTDPGAEQGHQTYAAEVRAVEAALKLEGHLSATYASDGSFGTSSIAAYAAWQRDLGYSGKDADGIPGMTSLAKLGARYGFTVKA